MRSKARIVEALGVGCLLATVACGRGGAGGDEAAVSRVTSALDVVSCAGVTADSTQGSDSVQATGGQSAPSTGGDSVPSPTMARDSTR